MLSWTTASPRFPRTGRLHEPTAVDQTPKILFVQADSGESLNSSLQLQQSEAFGDQFKDNRAISQLTAQARNRGRQNPAVVARHLLTEDRPVLRQSPGPAAFGRARPHREGEEP